MSTDPDTNRRITILEAQVALLSQHLGLAYPEMPGALAMAAAAGGAGGGVPSDVVELKRSGNTIGAIKRLREHTGLDLVSAKDIVERIV